MKTSLKLDGAKDLAKKLAEAGRLEAAKAAVLHHGGEIAEKSSRAVPVRTSFLKTSMTVKSIDEGLGMSIKYGAEYAGIVEKGSRYQNAKPYLEPALNAQKDKFLADMARLTK